MGYRRILTLLLLWLTVSSVNAIVAPKAALPLGDLDQTEVIDLSVSTPETVYRRNHGVGSGFRFYDPSLQRWINQVPIGEVGENNLCQAFYNDPRSFVDPHGLDNIFNPAAGQNALASLVITGNPRIGGPVNVLHENAGGNPFAGTVAGVVAASHTVAAVFVETYDLVMTGREIYLDPTDPWGYLGMVPGVPRGAGKAGKDVCEMTAFGWRGQEFWRDAVNKVARAGTIEKIGDRIPSKGDTLKLLEVAGSRVDRIEGPHLPPNLHRYPHINFTTPEGKKGTIKIEKL